MCKKIKNIPGVWRRAVCALFAVLLSGFICTAAGCKGSAAGVPMLSPADGGLDLPSAASYILPAEDLPVEYFLLSDSRCVPTAENAPEQKLPVKSALLFDITGQRVLLAQDCYQKLYPASTTKLLTALTICRIVQEEGRSLSDQVAIREQNGGITVSGAKLCGFMKGDVVSLSGLLTGLLVYSGNDAAAAAAEYLCGDEKTFVARMNEIAGEIGATHTHFVNSHGLHNSEHYTTAYDMYLIFLECLRQDGLLEISGRSRAVVDYTGADGREKQMELETTNPFLLETAELPEGLEIRGGKTGSTPAAGDCLIMLSRCGGREYISAVFGADSREELYEQMNSLLELAAEDAAKGVPGEADILE